MPHWDWNTAAGPPGSRRLALRLVPDDEEAQVALAGPDEQVNFEAHIKPLFRRRHLQSMQFAFDLWSFDDVKGQAEAILERVRNGSMPCDGRWPQEKVDAFDRWVTTGTSK